MNIEIKRDLASATQESLEIKFSWDPSNEEEEGLVAVIALVADLVSKYHRLNTLAGEDSP